MIYTVAPGFVLDDDMYELARQEVALRVPDKLAGFTLERFVARESWRLIPDVENPDVPFFKAEMIVKNEPPWSQTNKINVWFAADLRRDGEPIPHNHPWKVFRGYVLMGGFVDDRYTVQNGQVQVQKDCEHAAGQVHAIEHHVYHEVTGLLGKPGRTMTFMDCGPGIKEDWGYLNPDTGLYTPNKESLIDPRFQAALHALNPHLRK